MRVLHKSVQITRYIMEPNGRQAARFGESEEGDIHASPFASTRSTNLSWAETNGPRSRKYTKSEDRMLWTRPISTAGSNDGAYFCASRRSCWIGFLTIPKTRFSKLRYPICSTWTPSMCDCMYHLGKSTSERRGGNCPGFLIVFNSTYSSTLGFRPLP